MSFIFSISFLPLLETATIPSPSHWFHYQNHREGNAFLLTPDSCQVHSLSQFSQFRARTEVAGLRMMSAAKLGFFFWGFLSVYVTLFRQMARAIRDLIRGDGEWSGFSELICLGETKAFLHIDIYFYTYVPCSMKIRIATAGPSKTERERQKQEGMRQTVVKRSVQTGKLIQRPAVSRAGLAASGLPTFWVSEINSSFIIPTWRLSSFARLSGWWWGEGASGNFARLLKGWERKPWEPERSTSKDDRA